MKFNDNFDWDNAWYDAIQVNSSTILLIGPPLYNDKNWIKSNVIFQDDSGNSLPFQFGELDRVCYTAITTNKYLSSISMISNGHSIQIPINRNNGNMNGKKVMFTLQKNNPIPWIQQWITYHTKVHGVDGFLIYDNGSTDYTLEELERNLQGLSTYIKIVSWPYPYGPQGSDNAPWDSDYGQYVMFEHAKWRYLTNALLVLNNDIDEFIVTNGIDLNSIMTHLQNNQIQCLRYKGIWIEPYDIVKNQSADVEPFNSRDIRNYYCTDPNNHRGIGYKWMLTPSNQSISYQWLVHHVNGQMMESDQLFYGHYLALNTNWSWRRDHFDGNVSDLVPNDLLSNSLKKM
jgi:hypothetical protein